jgi:predicted metal-dependent hydrolase
VDSLLLHELVHTVVLDHSPRFWKRLSEIDPKALEHRVAMRRAGTSVPAWADV